MRYAAAPVAATFSGCSLCVCMMQCIRAFCSVKGVFFCRVYAQAFCIRTLFYLLSKPKKESRIFSQGLDKPVIG